MIYEEQILSSIDAISMNFVHLWTLLLIETERWNREAIWKSKTSYSSLEDILDQLPLQWATNYGNRWNMVLDDMIEIFWQSTTLVDWCGNKAFMAYLNSIRNGSFHAQDIESAEVADLVRISYIREIWALSHRIIDHSPERVEMDFVEFCKEILMSRTYL